MVDLNGLFTDGSRGLGCVGSGLVVDTSIAPTYQWPDSGAAAIMDKVLDDVCRVIGESSPTTVAELQMQIDQLIIDTINGPMQVQPSQLDVSSFLGDLLADLDLARFTGQAFPAGPQPLLPGEPFQGFMQFDLSSQGQPLPVPDIFVVPNAPHGFGDRAPLGMGTALIPGGAFQVDSFFDVFYQISISGFNDLGEIVDLPVQLELFPTPNGFGVQFQGVVESAAPVGMLQVHSDVRGFFRSDLPVQPRLLFSRGDYNMDDRYNIADPVNALNCLFGSSGCNDCLKSGDANDDGNFNIADPLCMLNDQFLNSCTVAPPFGECGEDPTPDELTCNSYALCDSPSTR